MENQDQVKEVILCQRCKGADTEDHSVQWGSEMLGGKEGDLHV